MTSNIIALSIFKDILSFKGNLTSILLTVFTKKKNPNNNKKQPPKKKTNKKKPNMTNC